MTMGVHGGQLMSMDMCNGIHYGYDVHILRVPPLKSLDGKFQEFFFHDVADYVRKEDLQQPPWGMAEELNVEALKHASNGNDWEPWSQLLEKCLKEPEDVDPRYKRNR